MHRDPLIPLTPTHREILKPLVYYGIWGYPLRADELFAFLQVNSLGFAAFQDALAGAVRAGIVSHHNGHYFLPAAGRECVARREASEQHARRLWRWARLSTHIIKRTPFVRAVFVSGELSKNATSRGSDIDFVILTEPGRLWISRTLLITFKKTVLLNSKRFFCLNTFNAVDHLSCDEHNVYIATEVVHLKPLFNSMLYAAYRDANRWTGDVFPNFRDDVLPEVQANNRRSFVQRMLEAPFLLLPADRLDLWLESFWQRVWRRRYSHLDDATRDRVFRSSRSESRAYPGDFQRRVLELYARRLRDHGLTA